MKTPISLMDGIVDVIHDVLGTRQAFENHPDEVTDAEREEIIIRLELAWFPESRPAQDKQKTVELEKQVAELTEKLAAAEAAAAEAAKPVAPAEAAANVEAADAADEGQETPASDIGDAHAKFLVSRGYAPANADEARAFVGRMNKKDRKSFLADFALWQAEQK